MDWWIDGLTRMKNGVSRRKFLGATAVVQGSALLGLAGLQGAESAGQGGPGLRVVCIGGHPDDPESGCAGTIARYVEAGQAVTVIYLTRGERGISGKGLDEAAAIRTAECQEACKILGAKPVFAGQIDGATEINRKRVEDFTTLLAAENPDVVLTQWPIDTHLDHQVASLLTMRACMTLKRRPQIYFYEVNTGSQTHGFAPNAYVDISSLVGKKKAALFAHKSQNGEGIWREHHETVANFRGREAGVAAAEAFFHLNRNLKEGVPLVF